MCDELAAPQSRAYSHCILKESANSWLRHQPDRSIEGRIYLEHIMCYTISRPALLCKFLLDLANYLPIIFRLGTLSPFEDLVMSVDDVVVEGILQRGITFVCREWA